MVLFGLGSFLPKVVGFFLVPLYTNCMSPSDYGLADLIVSTASLLYPLLSLKVGDAMMAFMYDRGENKSDVVSSAFFISALGCAIPALFLAAVPLLSGMIQAYEEMLSWVPILMILDNLYSFLVNYLRGKGKTVALTVVGLVNSLFMLVFNVLLILILEKGLWGYMVSMCGSLSLAVIVGFIASGIRSELRIVPMARFSKAIRRMLLYSAPLVVSGFAWWLNTSCDRWFISAFVGVSENGLYAVAFKIPMILSAFQSIFSQAWLLSAFSQKDSADSTEYSSRVFCLYSLLLGLVCSVLVLIDKPLSSLLFQSEFYNAWCIVPPLLISSYVSALGSFQESLFQTKYDSKSIFVAIMLGAGGNIVLILL